MNQPVTRRVRVLAIAPSARGFGFSVMEDGTILECGIKIAKGDKNARSLSKIERLMEAFGPGVLVLQDMAARGCRRAPRIKALNEQIAALGKERGCKIRFLMERTVRRKVLGGEHGTKHEVAEELARRFPKELSRKLPPKRRAWDSEDARMDMFAAVALAAAFW